jgi:predicted HNH restriction endonuclease
MSDSDLKIKFGSNTLHIGFKVNFAGNAFFNHRTNPSEEFIELCEIISNKLQKDYRDHNGTGKRVWGRLNDNDIEKLKSLGSSYSKNPSAFQNKQLTKPEVLAEEVINPEKYQEGTTKLIPVNVYERNPKARKKCLEHYGYNCSVCDFDFGETFGKLGDGFIHVHHLKPLSEIGQEYTLDPIKDLRPVCPNCHSMLHRQTPILSIEELITIKKANN